MTTKKATAIRRHLFLGVSLGGGKSERTAVTCLEYFPDQKKFFLTHVVEKIVSRTDYSADAILVDFINNEGAGAELVAFDVPLKLPKCIRCRLKCPGYEKCSEPEINWLRQTYKKHNANRKPKKLFTPYTERCVEAYIANELEEKFHPSHALGANSAPLLARALFLSRRIKSDTIEVYPKLSLWRIGRHLGIQKSYLRFHKHSVGGEEAREAILGKLLERQFAFVYEQDRKILVSNCQAFDAFLCALTGVLKFSGQVEPRPKGFPRSEPWIEFPKTYIAGL